MLTVQVHPIQLKFTTSPAGQTCDLCGAAEVWTSPIKPDVSPDCIARALHLVHLVVKHKAEVQHMFTREGRREEVTVTINP
ncbi:hypothetical protein HUO13_11930 [Saccharopolyspora erythraea]|uniref:hypothetical protein n=1 Tax=Saccharopolyspora erythraea TaxID=1836 RepID=UPI001BA485FD|nr:hypothetical protein [Saccharopolyspora erythraea]QUH01424.1 hypothetical protein HUO13_11930 [Saccharopolyspora erythraea]